MYHPYYLSASVCSVQTVEEENKHGSESSSAVEWGIGVTLAAFHVRTIAEGSRKLRPS